MASSYTAQEWAGAIASMGRLVDVRNFPDVAAEVLLGKRPAFLGRGSRLPAKALDPKVIGALVFWTKGPAAMLVQHPGLRKNISCYWYLKATALLFRLLQKMLFSLEAAMCEGVRFTRGMCLKVAR